MKGIITKILQCAAVLAFCFSAEGMQKETFNCQNNYRPTGLSITFNSAEDALGAIQQGINLKYPGYAQVAGQPQNIELLYMRADNATAIYDDESIENVIIGFDVIFEDEPITLNFRLRDALYSGNYVLTCSNYISAELYVESQSKYWYRPAMTHFPLSQS